MTWDNYFDSNRAFTEGVLCYLASSIVFKAKVARNVRIIRFYLSVAYGESEVKLFACKEIINRW
jgi:hypothetical protein